MLSGLSFSVNSIWFFAIGFAGKISSIVVSTCATSFKVEVVVDVTTTGIVVVVVFAMVTVLTATSLFFGALSDPNNWTITVFDSLVVEVVPLKIATPVSKKFGFKIFSL